jgi:hypothetical protein
MYEMTHFFLVFYFLYMNVVGFFNIGYWFIFTNVCINVLYRVDSKFKKEET